MENLQNQISELRSQLHQLNCTVESMPKQIIAALSDQNLAYSLNQSHRQDRSNGTRTSPSRESLEYNFSHKDILDEDTSNNCVTQSDQIPCEWQVGRLSAQLTSAYERIAELEQQLLSRHLARR
jgi:regulator of replication initiation timing